MTKTFHFYACTDCDKTYKGSSRGATWALKHAATCGAIETLYVENNRVVRTELGIPSN